MVIFYVIKVVIFDMDGLFIDLELLWLQVEFDIFIELGLDILLRDFLFDIFGLCIDLVVKFWFQFMFWQGLSQVEVCKCIIVWVIDLVEEIKLVLFGVEYVLELCCV